MREGEEKEKEALGEGEEPPPLGMKGTECPQIGQGEVSALGAAMALVGEPLMIFLEGPHKGHRPPRGAAAHQETTTRERELNDMMIVLECAARPCGVLLCYEDDSRSQGGAFIETGTMNTPLCSRT